jgi:hypothetical protein
MAYTDLTDEEYDALDEELSRTVPKFGPLESDWFIQRELCQLGLAQFSTTQSPAIQALCPNPTGAPRAILQQRSST